MKSSSRQHSNNNDADDGGAAFAPPQRFQALVHCRELVHGLGRSVAQQQGVVRNLRERSSVIIKALWYITGEDDKVDPLILPTADVTYLQFRSAGGASATPTVADGRGQQSGRRGRRARVSGSTTPMGADVISGCLLYTSPSPRDRG